MRWIVTLSLTQAVVVAIASSAEDKADASELDKTFEAHVPIRAITHGPNSHWFGYYDKHQFDVTGRYVLGMAVDFDDRPPRPDDAVTLGMVDTRNDDVWIPFDQTTAWCWQQGCMLQWLPGSATKVIYNVRKDGHYASVIRDVFSGETRTLTRPVYTVSPDGKQALSVNFARVGETRPGYGYYGIDDPGANKLHPDDDGLYVVNIETNNSHLLFSLDQIAHFGREVTGEDGKHWFNHLLFNTDGTRFIFLHRWHRNHGWYTRMLTAAPDGTGLFIVADHDIVSHFIWRNPTQILAWSRQPETGDHFHLYTDRTDKYEVIGEGILRQDGHCTYSPDGKWILTDTYPDKNRMQHLMLYRPTDGKLVKLGKFYLPPDQRGEIRCDLHARWDRSGDKICIDSMHINDQRQLYLLDVGDIVSGK